MRYVKAEQLLRLAIRMQATRAGLSLHDIQEETGQGRRSAERMRDSIDSLFGLEEVDTGERTKRWRINPLISNRLVRFIDEELAAIGTAQKLARRENLDDLQVSLGNVRDKILALSAKDSRALELDTGLLLETEGLALRPGPRPNISNDLLVDLREAIKSCQQVTLHHYARGSNKLSRRKAYPYGFLYGNRNYLVAFCPDSNPQYRGYRLFSLSNIENVVLSDENFERDETFSLQDYIERSFGVFQEEPFDVVWKFSPNVANDAKEFLFHPTQEFEEQSDGSLIVRFKAGGAREMAWHLYTWGDEVEVLEPEDFWDFNKLKRWR